MTEKPNGAVEWVVVSDPGVDDALALLFMMAQNLPTAMIATYGNASTELTGRNLQYLAQFEREFRRDRSLAPVQVFAGADRPQGSLQAFAEQFEGIHGKDGMNGLGSNADPIQHQSAELYDAIAKENVEKVHVLSLGALTEVVPLLRKIGGKVATISVMGGALAQQGNVGPHREANMRHDPAAFQYILEFCNAGEIPLNLIPLDMTEVDVLEMTPRRGAQLRQRLINRQSERIARLTERLVAPGTTYTDFYRSRKEALDLTRAFPAPHNYDGAPFHDLTAVFAALYSNMFAWRAQAEIQADDTGDVGYWRDYFPSFASNGPHGKVNIPVRLSHTAMTEKYFETAALVLAAHFT